MFKTCTLSTINNKITPPHELNLQLHATEPNQPEKVSNPYDFSITHKKIRFRSLTLTPEILSTIKVYGAEPWYNNKVWKEAKVRNLTTINGGVQFELPKISNAGRMFEGCIDITSIDLSNFDTNNITNMKNMFYQGFNIISIIGLSNFNTSNVTDMNGMFYWCSSLPSIDVSSFDTSNVTDMKIMFSTCEKVTSIDLSNFNTSNVTDMSDMFTNCFNLAKLDLSNFDTSKVINMHSMFSGCKRLETIICPNGFDCSNVTNIGEMFHSCLKLRSPLHLKNVKSSLIEPGSSPSNWVVKDIKGTRGVHYIVDSVI